MAELKSIDALLLAGTADGVPSALLKTLESLLSVSSPGEILNLVLLDAAQLKLAAAASYRHTNGFDKIVLLAGHRESYKLRLHVWWPGTMLGYREHVHNHRWNFATHLVLGEYQLETLFPSSAGIGFHAYEYHSPENESFFKTKPVGSLGLETGLKAYMRTGSAYAQDARLLHRVERLGEGAVMSLMLQGPVLFQSTDVMTHEGAQLPSEGDASRFSPEELTAKLIAVRELLGD